MLLYSDLPGSGRWSTSSASSSGFSGSFFLAWPLWKEASYLAMIPVTVLSLILIGIDILFSLSSFPRTSLKLYYEERSLFFRRFWLNRTSKQNIKNTTWKSSSMCMCWYLQCAHSSNTACTMIFWNLSVAMPTIAGKGLNDDECVLSLRIYESSSAANADYVGITP